MSKRFDTATCSHSERTKVALLALTGQNISANYDVNQACDAPLGLTGEHPPLLKLGMKAKPKATTIIKSNTHRPNHDACNKNVDKQANGAPYLQSCLEPTKAQDVKLLTTISIK